jgi:hypothetical protein
MDNSKIMDNSSLFYKEKPEARMTKIETLELLKEIFQHDCDCLNSVKGGEGDPSFFLLNRLFRENVAFINEKLKHGEEEG